MGALSDQLRDLEMEHFIPLAENAIDEEDEGDYENDRGSPNAPSPSETDAIAAAVRGTTMGTSGLRSMFKAQKHQVWMNVNEPLVPDTGVG